VTTRKKLKGPAQPPTVWGFVDYVPEDTPPPGDEPPPLDKNVHYVHCAQTLEEAQKRYAHQFGFAHDSPQVYKQLLECYQSGDASIQAPTKRAVKTSTKKAKKASTKPSNKDAVPSHLILAILLSQGASGSGEGRRTNSAARMRDDYVTLVRARARFLSGENIDDVAEDAAKHSYLKKETIRDRVLSPKAYKLPMVLADLTGKWKWLLRGVLPPVVFADPTGTWKLLPTDPPLPPSQAKPPPKARA
jgi:hypothetical protein